MNDLIKQLLATLERNLHAELGKFKCLPFYLAVLYLKTGRSATDSIRRGHINVKYNYKRDEYIIDEIGNQIQTTNAWNDLTDPIPDTTGDVYIRGYHPFKSPFTVEYDKKVGVGQNQKHHKNLKHVHIYSRNKTLINLINELIDLYMQVDGEVPRHYALPYLFFNQNKTLTYIYIDKETDVSVPAWNTKPLYPVYIKYNPYNQCIRMRTSKDGKNYTALNMVDLLNFFYSTESAPFSHSKNDHLKLIKPK